MRKVLKIITQVLMLTASSLFAEGPDFLISAVGGGYSSLGRFDIEILSFDSGKERFFDRQWQFSHV